MTPTTNPPSTSNATPTTKTKPIRTNKTIIGTTKWLSLQTIDYKDEYGTLRKWDIASRTTKQPNTPDAVVIIPILKSSKHSTLDTLLVQQYRPPLDKYTLEFPAGLIDTNETAFDAAIRELWEETGYVGTVDESLTLLNTNNNNKHTNQVELSMSPGLTDETIQIVVLNVDLDDKEKNGNPKQNLDEGENIVVKRVPLTVGLKEVLSQQQVAAGSSGMMVQPISLLYSFAIGLEMGSKLLGK